MYEWILLILMLAVIFIAAFIFTNALEYAGEKLKLSEGVTGSVFAAVGTALPETIVPILAIVNGSSNQSLNEEVSVGAILGAPLMLSTLAFFLMGFAAYFKRGADKKLNPEKQGFIRDLDTFLIAFFLAAIAMYLPHKALSLRLTISLGLVLLYFFYLLLTFRSSKDLVGAGHDVKPLDPLFLTKIKFKNNLYTIFLQLIIGLFLLILGAKGFIHSIEAVSHFLNISALLLSLLIIPIATELPEKVNSIIWVRKNKDTLAVGNLSGAMVFQGTLLPAIGILLTPWEPSKTVLIGIVITFIGAAWLRFLVATKWLYVGALGVNGLLYVVYLFLVLH